QVALTVDRKGKKKELTVTLNNREGGTALAAKEHRDLFEQLGADMQAIDEATAKKLDIAGGVQITQLHPGKLRKYTQMREGFIVTKVDGRAVKTVDELAKALKDKEGGVMLEGVYPDLPGVYYYAFGLGI
ncbi:MAG: serine protease, partial [Saprospiraceae bacterium]|nr:serine protease [Saprospiraceae bacterium]